MRERKRRGHSRYYLFFVLSLITLLGVVGGVYYLARSLDILKVEKINISGNKATDTALIRKVTDKYIGVNLLAVSSSALKHELEKFSRVREVKIRKSLLHTLNVKLTERQGAIYLRSLEGDLYPVDEDAIILARYDLIYNEDLPVFSTHFTNAQFKAGRKIKSPGINRVLQFHKQISHEAADFLPRISEYYLVDNTVYIIDAISGTRIIPPKVDLAAQLKRYLFVSENGNIGNHKLLDLRFDKQVVVKAE